MSKFGLFVASAFIVAGIGGWIASSSSPQAHVVTTSNSQIEAVQMMAAAGNLPTEHIVDYSLVFE